MSERESCDRGSAEVDRTNECICKGTNLNNKGYAFRKYQGKRQLVHRVAWQQTFGPIPSGLDVCHKCDVPNCYNVEHLFIGTRKDNMQDAKAKGRLNSWNSKKTICPRGHPYSHLHKGRRYCRICLSDHQRRYRARTA